MINNGIAIMHYACFPLGRGIHACAQHLLEEIIIFLDWEIPRNVGLVSISCSWDPHFYYRKFDVFLHVEWTSVLICSKTIHMSIMHPGWVTFLE